MAGKIVSVENSWEKFDIGMSDIWISLKLIDDKNRWIISLFRFLFLIEIFHLINNSFYL
jgi:hypothetical protein